MKICAIICEYNPFHNGHLYQIQAAKAATGADAILCLMSGNFVQRGEAAVFEKHLRAKHALLGGADAVIELPAVFATSNAEIFAKGAVKLLSSVPDVKMLSFGTETASEKELLNAATLLLNEPKEISERIRKRLQDGVSYAKARAEAWEDKIPQELLTSPNNILALEYAKAILTYQADIKLFPIKRLGGGYNETALNGSYSSATSIRTAWLNGENVRYALPDFVPDNTHNELQLRLQTAENYALISKPTYLVEKTPDCSEGLENALKREAAQGERDIAAKLTSLRYTASRLKRILLQNALNISKTDVFNALENSLYLKLLAVKTEREDVLSALGKTGVPLLVRPYDEEKLSNKAKAVLQTDKFADALYAQLCGNSFLDKPIFL